eukprot:scaffold244126_cov30-Tisochrysis_lutea.AAC.7
MSASIALPLLPSAVGVELRQHELLPAHRLRLRWRRQGVALQLPSGRALEVAERLQQPGRSGSAGSLRAHTTAHVWRQSAASIGWRRLDDAPRPARRISRADA